MLLLLFAVHIGNIGLAQKVGAPYTTSPPGRTGGNVDNRRIGIGATMVSWLSVTPLKRIATHTAALPLLPLC